MSKAYRIRVTRFFDESENSVYNFFSFYVIEAIDHSVAEKEARKMFCEAFGAAYDKTAAYTFNKLSHEK